MSGALTINSNGASLNAQRRLGQSTASLRQSFERLSSGLRINRASDDAAGLAIASSLNTDSRVYTQAIRNTNDAISLYAIAEGALTSLVGITTRLQELAQQSANGVLSHTQRKSLNGEAQALRKEYLRIVQTTQFNGLNLLDNSMGTLRVQVGYGELNLSGGEGATGSFAASGTFSTGDSPSAMAMADLNGDGLTDLITADYLDDQLSVFIGNGNGTFKAGQAYETGANPGRAAVADVNGDGAIDLISADVTGDQLGIFLGNGNGTFKSALTIAANNSPYSILAEDLNGDGNVDLISSSTDSELEVFLGNGNGTFKAARTYSSDAGASSLLAVDINNDGNLDIVSPEYNSDRLSVFLGNGDGSLKHAQTYTTGDEPNFVTAGDVNGDDIVDLISADYGADQISVFLGNGNGSFTAALTYATGDRPSEIVASDFDGNGVVDLVTADYGSDQLSVFFGNGDGSFRIAQTYFTGSGPYGIISTDIDGDGIADLVSADYGSDQISVFLGNGSAQAIVAPAVGAHSLLSQQDSLDALTAFDQILDRLTASLGQLGANESRLSAVSNVLQQTRANYTSAASQILDVDVAEESAHLARTEILQQAGAAVLTQANQQPALALSLLRGI